MKYFLIAASSLIVLNSTAQANPDMILLHTGERLSVYISSISDRTVTFNYPEEDVEYTKSKNSIEEIVFASGRRADGSEKVNISGAQKIDEKATKKIKQQTAQMGAHIVYIQSQTRDKGIRRVNRSIKSGVAYGYR